MIYKKEANFPHPILSNNSRSYNNPVFNLDIELSEINNNYRFNIKYEFNSVYLKNLIDSGGGELILVVQSKDNKFYNITSDTEYIDIPKTRISLTKRTLIQLLIKAKENISFKNNDDLNEFYLQIKENIIIPKHAILGYSNVEQFDGNVRQPLELFEKKVDPYLKTSIKFDLGSDTIIINYQNEDLQYHGIQNHSTLNNHYVYIGLQRALLEFINEHSSDDGTVYVDRIEQPRNGLQIKIYNLLVSKTVDELNFENIDEVIHRISDKIIEKHTNLVRGLTQYGS